ncbi:hypothetical protein DYB37_005595 [Aphanomyces astaci]|uniref:KEN domain-containing protein n=1 Tax=Aphanomyces astaci TaxID=112090 RepID=A0A3R7AD90_APHAT|nr:hypothetical protein DYB35_004924 [Aphanomyces astaci]RHZ14303.1 hypothetical protein DYB37_005595 [Aphanomyces astaci]
MSRRRQKGRHGAAPSDARKNDASIDDKSSDADALTRAVAEHEWFLRQSRDGNMQVVDDMVRAKHMPHTASHRLDAIMDADGNNALLLAASGGHVQLVQALHASGTFDLHVVNVHGDNALHLAAFQGHASVVSWLEQQGVTIHVLDDQDGHMTTSASLESVPTTSTASWCHDALCSLFFDFVSRGDIPGLDELVSNVGRHSFPWGMTDDCRRSALHVAAEANQLNMLQLLLTKPALSLRMVTDRRDTCLHVAVGDVTAVNAQKWTALDLACYIGHVAIAMTLLDMSSLTLSFSCLALAVQGGGHVALLDKLLAVPAATALMYDVEVSSGDSLLHMACAMRHECVCNLLLNFYNATSSSNNNNSKPVPKKWVDVVDRDGCNPVQVIVGLNWLDGIRLVVTSGRLTMDEAMAAATVDFVVKHATSELFAFVYARLTLPWQQQMYEGVVVTSGRLIGGRPDLVAVCNRIHDGHAAAAATAFIPRDTPVATPRPSKHRHMYAKAKQKPAKDSENGKEGSYIADTHVGLPYSTSLRSDARVLHGEEDEAAAVATPLCHRLEVSSPADPPVVQMDTQTYGPLSVVVAPGTHANNDAVLHGAHIEWGPVLVCCPASAAAAADERAHGQLLHRLVSSDHRLLHFVDDEVVAVTSPHISSHDINTATSRDQQRQNCVGTVFAPTRISAPPSCHFIMYEHATTTWLETFVTNDYYSMETVVCILRDGVMAVASLHRHDRVHGNLTPGAFWLVGQSAAAATSCKLLCRTSTWVDRTTCRGRLALADDVLALGQCIAFALYGHDGQSVGKVDPGHMPTSTPQVPPPIPRRPQMSAEALDLLNAMTHIDPTRRLAMQDVTRHPFLWPASQKLAYIEMVANHAYVELTKRQQDISWTCHDKDEYDGREREGAMDWGARVKARGLDVHRHRQYDTSSVVDLVRWIRNLKQHAAELPPHTWRLLQSGEVRDIQEVPISIGLQQRIVEEFVCRQMFPDLVLRLWQCLGPLESFYN